MNIPHVRIVIAFCVLAVGGYAGFSVWVLATLKDATMVGDIIGTWKSFAVAAFAFWLGSSSGGKAKDGPTDVNVVNNPKNPVPVEENK